MGKRNILYISMSIPYDKIRHAGGKTFNYYINSFAADTDNDITLIAKVLDEEDGEIENINPRIRTMLVRTPKDKILRYFSYLKSLNSKFNPLYPYGNVLTKEIFNQIESCLDELKHSGYVPDIVILEWTWMLLFIDQIKQRFPDAKYVASEHDVSFLGAKRQLDMARGLKKIYKKLFYENLKKRELSCINKCDYVVTHNDKDRLILLENGIPPEKLGVIAPYFEKPESIKRENIGNDIIFYGAMNRYENEISALWFIKNVMPRITDLDIRFVVIGNKPSQNLQKLASESIIITGFVDDVRPYFSTALCLAAPIQAGAGVKVKILEAMAMGVPVLTNDIGIEGIDAEDKKEYIHCTTPEDYEIAIRKIFDNEIDANAISDSAVALIRNKYDLQQSYLAYSNRVYELGND